MKRWVTWLGVLISISCATYFAGTVATHWRSLAQIPMHAGIIAAVGVASLIYMASYMVSARAWQLSILSLSGTVPYLGAARILMLSQFAKYLPGNVGHHVGRVLLARDAGLSKKVIAASMLIDTTLVVLAGAACSIPALTLLQKVLQERGIDGFKTVVLVICIFALLLAALATIPYVRSKIRDLSSLLTTPKMGLLAKAWACHCLNFVLGVAVLYTLMGAVTMATDSSPAANRFPEVLGVYAAAWLLGFLMPGAPAGLGVREVVLLLGLAPFIGVPAAMATTALLRLVTTAGDGIAFLVGVGLRRSHKQPPSSRDTGK